MTYEVILTEAATQQLSKMEKIVSKQIADKLENIMSIDRGKMIILVIEVGHRSNIYKKY
ncbi:MAG: hypothetical protein J4452_01410 [Candidatus Aenigmarchaeota archaeon]|nr:hypothetical protein [Candidatus Aenigmarchaeota archaeon]